jgi:hypothetical protein
MCHVLIIVRHEEVHEYSSVLALYRAWSSVVVKALRY